MEPIDQANLLAIEVIELLGNDKPAQEQIDLVEYLVSNIAHVMGTTKYNKITC